jgi:hypothetical protein
LSNFFDDKILNETKEIIRGMKTYFVNGKKDETFKKRMDKILELVNSNLKYLN